MSYIFLICVGHLAVTLFNEILHGITTSTAYRISGEVSKWSIKQFLCKLHSWVVLLIWSAVCVYQRPDEAGGWNWRESDSVHTYCSNMSWLLHIGLHHGLATLSGLPIFTSCHICDCRNSHYGKYSLRSRISVRAKSQNFSKGFLLHSNYGFPLKFSVWVNKTIKFKISQVKPAIFTVVDPQFRCNAHSNHLPQ